MAKFTMRESILSKLTVCPATGCWKWTAAKNQFGYGVLGVAGQRRNILAHRAAYAEWIGPIPHGLDLDHLCRVRECVNPEHLEPVTRQVNLLRGKTITAANAAKTHCPNGHPYSGSNLIIRRASGSHGEKRNCHICILAAKKRARDRARSKVES